MEKIDTGTLMQILRCMRDNFAENRERLIELDSQMGDGDLGIYMAAGMAKAYDAAACLQDACPGELLRKAGQTFALEAPSTMGTLLATAFMTAGKHLGNKKELDADDLAQLYLKMYEGMEKRGGAKTGDKTILDALYPALLAADECRRAGGGIGEIANSAYEKAKEGVETAKNMRAVYGRPAYFGDATIGKYDGGTIVGMLVCKAILDALI